MSLSPVFLFHMGVFITTGVSKTLLDSERSCQIIPETSFVMFNGNNGLRKSTWVMTDAEVSSRVLTTRKSHILCWNLFGMGPIDRITNYTSFEQDD